MIRLQSNLPLEDCQQKLIQAMFENDDQEHFITGVVEKDGSFWLEHVANKPVNFKQRYFSEKFSGELLATNGTTEIAGEFSGDLVYLSAIYLLAVVLGLFALGMLVTAVQSMNLVQLTLPLLLVAFIVYWLHTSRGLAKPGQNAIMQFLEEAVGATSVNEVSPT